MQAFHRTHCLPSILHILPAQAVLCPAWCKGEHVSCSGFRDTQKNKELLSFRRQPGDGELGARQLQRLWANGWHHSRKPLAPHVRVTQATQSPFSTEFSYWALLPNSDLGSSLCRKRSGLTENGCPTSPSPNEFTWDPCPLDASPQVSPPDAGP